MAIRILNLLARRNELQAALFVLAGLTACRHDELVTVMTDTDTGQEVRPSVITGLYILNEGNMGSNKCTLDYLDLSGHTATSHYLRNIYGERNPNVVMELGDVGNDLAIHDDRLWMVINCSNKVEVCDALTTRRIGQVDVPNCRYLCFDGHFAYVSSYVGPVGLDSHAPLGRVYKIDSQTLQKVDSVVVGYQPEQMAIVDGRLYVANSGGYRLPDYDNRVSIIDLDRFEVIRHIPVAINLHRLVADGQGQLWVTSRGDYLNQSAGLYCIDTRLNDYPIKRLDLPVSSLSLAGDSLYFIASSFSYLTGTNQARFGIIDVSSHQVVDDGSHWANELASLETPYAILVNPDDRSFYVMDAKNYVSSGELLHLDADGRFVWRVWTGDIPCAGCFLRGQAEPSE